MVGVIIWFVIIIWIVYAVSRKNQQAGNAGQRKPNTAPNRPSKAVPNQPSRPVLNQPSKAVPNQPSRPVLNQPSKAVPNQPAKAAGKNPSYDPWQGYNQSGNAMKQQATKERLQKKYNRAPQKQDDILQRARASVAEDFDQDGHSDIMKQVEDLMVKGPDTTIAFERDFVSEGLELLNRIQS